MIAICRLHMHASDLYKLMSTVYVLSRMSTVSTQIASDLYKQIAHAGWLQSRISKKSVITRTKSSKENICSRCLRVKSLRTLKPATGIINKCFKYPDMDPGMDRHLTSSFITSICCSTEHILVRQAETTPLSFSFSTLNIGTTLHLFLSYYY